MNRPTSKLNQHQLEQSIVQEQSVQQQTALEFDTAEEVLRHDAGQTPVPAAVAERLQKSIENEPRPARSWWRRVLGSEA
jgi:negative regulator of sigma E activity